MTDADMISDSSFQVSHTSSSTLASISSAAGNGTRFEKLAMGGGGEGKGEVEMSTQVEKKTVLQQLILVSSGGGSC